MPPSHASHSRKLRILAVDDHPIVRDGLLQLIASQTDMEACGGASDPESAEAIIRKQRPDLLLLDLAYRKADGLDFIKHLQIQWPDLRILVLSMHDEMNFAERALRAGARGYIMKDRGSEELLRAIRTISSGELYLSPRMTSILARRGLNVEAGPIEDRPFGQLTDREMQIFALLGSGMKARAISEELHLSVKTVETHRENIKKKLGERDARSLALRAAEWVRNSGN